MKRWFVGVSAMLFHGAHDERSTPTPHLWFKNTHTQNESKQVSNDFYRWWVSKDQIVSDIQVDEESRKRLHTVAT